MRGRLRMAAPRVSGMVSWRKTCIRDNRVYSVARYPTRNQGMTEHSVIHDTALVKPPVKLMKSVFLRVRWGRPGRATPLRAMGSGSSNTLSRNGDLTADRLSLSSHRPHNPAMRELMPGSQAVDSATVRTKLGIEAVRRFWGISWLRSSEARSLPWNVRRMRNPEPPALQKGRFTADSYKKVDRHRPI